MFNLDKWMDRPVKLNQRPLKNALIHWINISKNAEEQKKNDMKNMSPLSSNLPFRNILNIALAVYLFLSPAFFYLFLSASSISFASVPCSCFRLKEKKWKKVKKEKKYVFCAFLGFVRLLFCFRVYLAILHVSLHVRSHSIKKITVISMVFRSGEWARATVTGATKHFACFA